MEDELFYNPDDRFADLDDVGISQSELQREADLILIDPETIEILMADRFATGG